MSTLLDVFHKLKMLFALLNCISVDDSRIVLVGRDFYVEFGSDGIKLQTDKPVSINGSYVYLNCDPSFDAANTIDAMTCQKPNQEPQKILTSPATAPGLSQPVEFY